ncbi:MAG: ATP-dependent Clp protease adaptor ClpS [Anaerolineales bacterium]|nr:ATP-dependent Clp protease adaptor ClpS [Anaerolineales bacterium]
MSTPTPETTREISESWQAELGPFYRVILHNDHVTTVDFVLYVLTQIFLLDGPHAVQVMYTAHYQGSAYVQSLPLGEAQRRLHRAHYTAALAKFPLRLTLESE